MPVFTANVPGLLKVGDRIEIGGKIKENARKMSVNLCAQEGEEPKDVVLHFDVRFHRDNIISLSRKNGIWIGSGNYDTNYNMFVPGTIFRIIFEIKDTDVITIYCQGKFHSNFLPKIPLSMARYIVAWADVERITHCYFYMCAKSVSGDEPATFPAVPGSPRTAVAPVLTGDPKRCSRARKKSPHTREEQSSNESSDDETTNGRAKADGRADRYFYDTLTCQPVEEHKCGSPQSVKCRRDASKSRCRANFSRKYRDSTDIDRIDSEETDVASKSADSSTIESELVLPDMKKRLRRGKFGPLSQVVNFMGKSTKRN